MQLRLDLPRSITWLCLLVSIALLTANQVASFPHTYDDVFISLRYASNLASGNGFAFNPGERVEGASNFLWVIILAAAMKCGVSGLIFAKLAGIAAALATLIVLVMLGRELQNPLVGMLAAAILATESSFGFWSANGLETPFYTFLITLAVYLIVLEQRGGRRLRLSALVVLAIGLTRPEGPMFVALYCLYLLSDVLSDNSRVEPVAARVSFAVMGMAGFLLFRRLYFGAWVPNTFFAKVTGAAKMGSPPPGWISFRDFFFNQPIHFVYVLALLGLLSVQLSGRVKVLLAGVFLAQIGFILLVPSDWMEHWRFFVPMLPALSFLSGCGVAEVLGLCTKRSLVRHVMATAFMLAMGTRSALAVSSLASEARNQLACTTEMHFRLASLMKASVPAETRIALSDVGLIPYLTNFWALDLLGLTDAKIAKMNAHDAADYALSLRPDILIAAIREEQSPEGKSITGIFAVDREIPTIPTFAKCYALQDVFRSEHSPYALYVFMERSYHAKLVRADQLWPRYDTSLYHGQKVGVK